MAVTVSGLNYTQIAACDVIIGDTGVGGTWTGDSPTLDLVTYKEGGKSIAFVIKSTSGYRYATFTPTSSIDLTNKHVRLWFLSTLGGNLATKATQGITFYCTDGTNTGYWNLDGRDTYAGGWKNMCVDTSRAVDAGTKPTNMNAITAMGVALSLDTSGKNTETVWVDNLIISDGLVVYGDDSGGYFDFEDIYLGDVASGFGVVTKTGGVYFLTGAIQFGDSVSTNSCKFQALDQTVVFEDRDSDINSALMGFDVVDNGTGTTEFILGDISGGAGISGCSIRVENVAQSSRFYIDGDTDTDVDNFKLYGSTFLGFDEIALPLTTATVDIRNCSFSQGGPVIVQTAIVETCSFITSDDVGALISSTSHQLEACTFISCPHGIEFDTIGTYDLVDCVFIGGNGTTLYDIENSSAGLVTINSDESNPSYVEDTGAGSTVINNAVSLSIHVTDQDGVNMEDVRVRLEADTGGAAPYREAVAIVGSGTTATVTHTTHGLATGNTVMIKGVTEFYYNGTYTITVSDASTYTYTMAGSPSTPATGSPVCTQVFMSELTLSTGIATESFNFGTTQPYVGRARVTTYPPFYADVTFEGDIITTGLDRPVQMVLDQG